MLSLSHCGKDVLLATCEALSNSSMEVNLDTKEDDTVVDCSFSGMTLAQRAHIWTLRSTFGPTEGNYRSHLINRIKQ